MSGKQSGKVLKCDCEGAEHPIFKNSLQTILTASARYCLNFTRATVTLKGTSSPGI